MNFRSPLVWDVFAISTYFTISLRLLVPRHDPRPRHAARRAAGRHRRSAIFGLLSLGWNGSHRTWSRYETLYLLLAGLATPLVLSVHSIVSMDFATSLVPGWHTTIFPPYFVAGAIYSGFGMVLTLLIVTRQVMHLERYITARHLDAMAKVMLLTGSLVGFCLRDRVLHRLVQRQPLRAVRRSQPRHRSLRLGLLDDGHLQRASCRSCSGSKRRAHAACRCCSSISLLVNVGMWFERFVIIVTSLHRDFLPSSWAMYRPTIVEVGILIGSFGLFFTLLPALHPHAADDRHVGSQGVSQRREAKS